MVYATIHISFITHATQYNSSVTQNRSGTRTINE